MLTQQRLKEIVSLREGVKILADTLKREEAMLAELEALAMSFVKEGAVEPGSLTAAVNEVTGRSSPKWKEEYVDHMIAEHNLDKDSIEKSMKVKYPAKVVEKLAVSEIIQIRVSS